MTVMYCQNCGKEYQPGVVNFCSQCGSRLEMRPARQQNKVDQQVKETVHSQTFKIFAAVVGAIGFVFLCVTLCPLLLALLGLGSLISMSN